MIIGDRLRDARNSLGLSLTDIAAKADISAATLSRIENGKQGLDLEVFLLLAKILAVPPSALLDSSEETNESDPLAGRIASLPCLDRAKLWRELTETRRKTRRAHSSRQDNIEHRLDELFAQFEMIYEELSAMRATVRRRRPAAEVAAG